MSDPVVRGSVLGDAMRRAQEAQAADDAQYAPYAPTGGLLDRLSALLPSWLSGRAAVMREREKLRQLDQMTQEGQ